MRTIGMAALAVAVTSLGGCAYSDYGYGGPGHYGDYAYDGGRYASDLDGEGASLLDPWLADTDEGQRIVRLGFQDAGEGWIDAETADRANIWFRRYADTDGNLRLTDEEIRVALVQASLDDAY